MPDSLVSVQKKSAQFMLHDLLSVTGGTLLKGEGREPFSLAIDSRTLEPGDLFIAIVGDRLDGHAFLAQAFEKGACGAVVDSRHGTRAKVPEGAFLVGVADTLYGFQQLARFHRKRFDIPVVGVTGSNGKTTTKEMISAIFQERWTVLKNQGNFNNHIGLPLTLLQLDPRHEVAVTEMGISRPGELKRLCDIGLPTAGVITNIGPAHLEALGSLEGVLNEKGELFHALGEGSYFALNLDDPYLCRLGRTRNDLNLIRYSLGGEGEIVGKDVRPDLSRGETFRLVRGGEEVSVSLPLMGEHHVRNALAAAAIGSAFGFSLEEIRRGLERVQGMGMRMEVQNLRQGVQVINDSYNANPESVRAALQTLRRIARGHKAVVVLGDMLELGEGATEMHREVGRWVSEGGIDLLITVGDLAGVSGEAAVASGMDGETVWSFPDAEAAGRRLSESLTGGERILVKGSRKMGLERVIRILAETHG